MGMGILIHSSIHGPAAPPRNLYLEGYGAVFFLGLVVFVPFLRSVFHFSPMHPTDALIALGAGIVSILWFEGVKIVSDRKKPTPSASA